MIEPERQGNLTSGAERTENLRPLSDKNLTAASYVNHFPLDLGLLAEISPTTKRRDFPSGKMTELAHSSPAATRLRTLSTENAHLPTNPCSMATIRLSAWTRLSEPVSSM